MRGLGGKEVRNERGGGSSSRGSCNCTLDTPLCQQRRRWEENSEEEKAGRRKEKLQMRRGYKFTRVEGKEKEADGEMRQEDQKCVYEGSAVTRERRVAEVKVQKLKINI